MGIYRGYKIVETIGVKITFALVLLVAGLLSPWLITILVALVIALGGVLSFELILVGVILDLSLHTNDAAGLENIFFTLCFFLLSFAIISIKILSNRTSL